MENSVPRGAGYTLRLFCLPSQRGSLAVTVQGTRSLSHGGRWRYENTAFPDTKPSPRGEGAPKGRIGQERYERERGRSSQVRRLREYPSAAGAVPLPRWGRQRGGGFAASKGSQPRLAALGSPFRRKGLAWILPPSYGRRCPEGAEVGWGKRYPRHKAFPAWGRWRAERAG